MTAVSFAIADGKVMIRRLSAGIGPLNGGELRPKKTVTPAGSTSIGRRGAQRPVIGMSVRPGSSSACRCRTCGSCAPQEGNRANWYACVLAPERQRSPDGQTDAMRRPFGHWHGGIQRVLAGISEDTLVRHDLYYPRRPI